MNLQHAFQQPDDPAKSAQRMAAMRALLAGVAASMPSYETSPEQRALALWRLIQDEIKRIGQPEGKRRRIALEAALHLDPSNTGTSIDERLLLARDEEKFGHKASGERHGYDALRTWWGWGIRMLGHAVDERLDYLASEPAEWRLYFGVRDSQGTYRLPSRGAQPLFANLFVTSVFMRKRSVYRRITERIVTAREPNVAYYIARGYSAVGAYLQRTYVPVQPLWGCTAEHIIPDDNAEPPVTWLRFPQPLKEGQKAHFASETFFGDSQFDRRWIDVEVDHYGIAPGATTYDGNLPLAGLTIRVRFDETCIPTAVWWYAEVPERERYRRPLPGDPHLLDVVGLDVQKTFTDMPCQPRESYGIAFTWQ